MLVLSYRYKLSPTPRQAQTIEAWLEACRWLWNWALRERKDYARARTCRVDACSLRGESIIPPEARRPTYASQCRQLTGLKRERSSLQQVYNPVLQRTLHRLETAWVDMNRRGFGFPRFKQAGQLRTLVFPQLNKQVVAGNRIQLPKLGWVKFRKSRELPQGFQIRQLQIVRKASGYYAIVTLQADVEVPEPQPHGHAVGLDVGLERFLATSDGELVPNPRRFECSQRKLRLLQWQLKHKRKGSRRWRCLQWRIARQYERISDTRRDWFYKLAHRLCDRAGSIYAEALNLKALARSQFGKQTLDAAWGEFLSILAWVCRKRGVYFEQVEATYTSQVCPACWAHTGAKPLSQRRHDCPECGYTTDRDVAAAQVVSTVGQTGKMLAEDKGSGELVQASSRASQ